MVNEPLWYCPPVVLALQATMMGVSLDALALGLVLAAPFCPQVLRGAVTPQQLRSNFGTLPVRAALVERTELPWSLMRACRHEEALYWNDRVALTWQQPACGQKRALCLCIFTLCPLCIPLLRECCGIVNLYVGECFDQLRIV